MKELVEEYGNVVLTVLMAVLLLMIITAVRPLYRISVSRGDFEVAGYEPENLELSVRSAETTARTVSPVELLGESNFNPEDWIYQTTSGNHIYYQNENLDNLIFVSEYSDSGMLNYIDVVLGDFGSFVDEVTIILNRNSTSEITHSLVVIKE